MNLNNEYFSKVIVALDDNDIYRLIDIVNQLSYFVNFYKVGLQSFISIGKELIKILKSLNCKVFLDLKIYDTPNTIFKTVEEFEKLNIDYFTIDTKCDIKIFKELSKNTNMKIIGIGNLTSDSSFNIREEILNYLDGHITPFNYLNEIPNNLIKITPSIRPVWSNVSYSHQNNTTTPLEALYNGSDYIILGRTLTKEKNMLESLYRMIVSDKKYIKKINDKYVDIRNLTN